MLLSGPSKIRVTATTGVNGTGYTVESGAAGALAHYPHARKVNGYIHISGCSSRQADNTHVGAEQDLSGKWKLDIEAQTRQVIRNIQRILQTVIHCTCTVSL
jgi:2-aminomuconate deaminase